MKGPEGGLQPGEQPEPDSTAKGAKVIGGAACGIGPLGSLFGSGDAGLQTLFEQGHSPDPSEAGKPDPRNVHEDRLGAPLPRGSGVFHCALPPIKRPAEDNIPPDTGSSPKP